MNTNRIRFGTHARAFRANGFRSIISVKGNKAPGVLDWARYGSEPPSDEFIELWRLEYPDCGIGLVMDGRVVALDIDICEARFRSAGFTVKDAAREAPALSRNIQALAFEMLGATGFVRVGLPPKAMLFYRAVDAVPTMPGGAVEIFSATGSKQVVLGGFHPEAVDEYRWVSRCNPITHRFDDLPQVTSQQVIDFRARSLGLCDSAGLKPQQHATAGHISGRVSNGIVGDYMSEVLSLIGKAWREDSREIAADYFRASIDGEKHYRMVAVCGALILRRFTDDEIIAALEPVYRAIVHDDPSMSRLRVCPLRMRAGMRARGTNVTTLFQLDEWFGPHWSIRNA
jgi:hypothetical protein